MKVRVPLGDGPAVEVSVPEGSGDVWIYRDHMNNVFASRQLPKTMPRGTYVIRKLDISTPKTKVPKSAHLYSQAGAYNWDNEVA